MSVKFNNEFSMNNMNEDCYMLNTDLPKPSRPSIELHESKNRVGEFMDIIRRCSDKTCVTKCTMGKRRLTTTLSMKSINGNIFYYLR